MMMTANAMPVFRPVFFSVLLVSVLVAGVTTRSLGAAGVPGGGGDDRAGDGDGGGEGGPGLGEGGNGGLSFGGDGGSGLLCSSARRCVSSSTYVDSVSDT